MRMIEVFEKGLNMNRVKHVVAGMALWPPTLAVFIVRKNCAYAAAAGIILAGLPLLAYQLPKAELQVIGDTARGHSDTIRNHGHEDPNHPWPEVPKLKSGSDDLGAAGSAGTWTDGVLQSSYNNGDSRFPSAPLANVIGPGADGLIPPDPNLAVGDTQVVAIVNTEFAIYNKSGGSPVVGPNAIHTIFSSAQTGTLCDTVDGGDPIVLYDQIHQRWLISQFAFNKGVNESFVCIAVSDSSDASGSYNAYAFSFEGDFPDYPKFAVWPDAYYFSANIFHNSLKFLGARVCAFDGAAMRGGTSAIAVCFQGGTGVYNLLPANLDGATGASGSTAMPGTNEPDCFLQLVSPGTLNLYQFHVDFNTTSNSTFTGSSLGVASFHEACGGSTCIPQPGVTEQLDSLGDRLMYRLSYRNFGSYESLLVNHSVQVSSASNLTGIRWYELRNSGRGFSVYQQSTFSPDSTYRWMASIAQDKQGNMLMGYSASSSTLEPSIGYTGRLAGDANGQMQTGYISFPGVGSQTSYNRWGDYTSMAVDPANDCTFWYINEYLPGTGSFNWNTQIQSFKFSGCH